MWYAVMGNCFPVITSEYVYLIANVMGFLLLIYLYTYFYILVYTVLCSCIYVYMVCGYVSMLHTT